MGESVIEANLGGAGDAGAPPSAPAPQTSTPAPAQATPPVRTQSTNDAPDAQVPAPEAAPERPRAKVGDVEWEQDGDDWFTTQKVDGKDERISLSRALSGERQMAAATQRFQEAKRVERSMENMLAEAASSPRAAAAFLEKLGVDPYELAEELLAESIEESKLTPAEKRVRDAERRLAEYEARERTQAEQRREAEIEAHKQRTRQAYVQAFDTQLDAVHAPKTPGARQWLHARIAQLANEYEDRGVFTTLPNLTKLAAKEFQQMTGVTWSAPAPAAPPAQKPRVSVPSDNEQPHPDDEHRFRDGRFRPRRDGTPREPRIDPRNPQTIIEHSAWERKYGRR